MERQLLNCYRPNMKRFFPILLLSILSFTACRTAKVKDPLDVKPNESIVFGRLILISRKPIPDKKTIAILFNETILGTRGVSLDDSGYFCIKLPIGKNPLAQIEFAQYSIHLINIEKGYISMNIKEANKVYYAGDITVDLSNQSTVKTQTLGLLSSIAAEKKLPAKPTTTIQAAQSTVDHFRKIFPNNKKEITTKLIRVRQE